MVPLIILGITTAFNYGLSAGSIVSYSVPPEKIGVGFGILFSLMNVTVGIIPPILGFIHSKLGFEGVCSMLFVIALFACFFNTLMWWEDKYCQNGIL